jgi:hypothetical protein
MVTHFMNIYFISAFNLDKMRCHLGFATKSLLRRDDETLNADRSLLRRDDGSAPRERRAARHNLKI